MIVSDDNHVETMKLPVTMKVYLKSPNLYKY